MMTDRWIDFTITIKATEGDVTFADTKEGTFAVRVADTMRLEAKKGGRIVNSEGQEDDAAWGMPAKWVDYTGPVDGETVGIAILSHPKSFRPNTRWHVRGYGLFAANPFGHKDFPKPELAEQGAVTIPKGDELDAPLPRAVPPRRHGSRGNRQSVTKNSRQRISDRATRNATRKPAAGSTRSFASSRPRRDSQSSSGSLHWPIRS